MTTDRENQVYMAKLAEQAERYDEMAAFMRDVAKHDAELSAEERSLLSIAYKHVIGARRASWRTISSIDQKEDIKEQELDHRKIKEYQSKIEADLTEVYTEILGVLDEHLIPRAETSEAKVFYHKMKGDAYHYLAEVTSGDERAKAAESAEQSYNEATTIANKWPGRLVGTHPIRLGLASNFSVFYYDILNSPVRACDLARKAFDLSISDIDTLSEESYQDSVILMLQLRENLTLWTPDLPEEAKEAFPTDGFATKAPIDASSEAPTPQVTDA